MALLLLRITLGNLGRVQLSNSDRVAGGVLSCDRKNVFVRRGKEILESIPLSSSNAVPREKGPPGYDLAQMLSLIARNLHGWRKQMHLAASIRPRR